MKSAIPSNSVHCPFTYLRPGIHLETVTVPISWLVCRLSSLVELGLRSFAESYESLPKYGTVTISPMYISFVPIQEMD